MLLQHSSLNDTLTNSTLFWIVLKLSKVHIWKETLFFLLVERTCPGRLAKTLESFLCCICHSPPQAAVPEQTMDDTEQPPITLQLVTLWLTEVQLDWFNSHMRRKPSILSVCTCIWSFSILQVCAFILGSRCGCTGKPFLVNGLRQHLMFKLPDNATMCVLFKQFDASPSLSMF